MNEEFKNFAKAIGAIVSPIMAAWIGYFIKEKYKSIISTGTSHSKRIRELEDKSNVMLGTLGAVGKTIAKEFVQVKNDINVINNTSSDDIRAIRSELSGMHLEILNSRKRIMELEKYADRHERALAVSHKLFRRHASDLAFLHKEHLKKLP